MLIDPSSCESLALVLLHFLWQGAAIAVIAAVIAGLLRGSSAQSRYVVHLAAMLLMAACLPITFAFVAARAPHATDSRDAAVAIEDGPVTESLSEPTYKKRPHADGSRAEVATVSSDAATPAETVPIEATTDSSVVTDVATTKSTIWQTLSPYIVGAYLLGLLAMLMRVAASMYGGQRLRRDSVIVDDDDLLAAIRRVAGRLGLRRVPVVAFCRRVSGPVVVGVLRPVILLPITLTTGLTPQQLEAILTHELAHLRRLDHVLLMLQRLLEAVLFFHPAVWYVSRCVSMERENCCDDAVVAAGAPRVAYAELLLKLAEDKMLAQCGATALAAGDRPSRLRQRVARLLNPPAEPMIRLDRAGTITVVCLLAAVVLPPMLSYVLAEPTQPVVERQADGERDRETGDRDDAVASFNPHSVQVVDSEGHGVAGAKIEVLGESDRVVKKLRGNDEGFVQIPPADEQTTLRVRIKADGYITHGERVGWDNILVFQNRVSPQIIELKRPAVISGTVLGVDGEPLSGAPLSITTNAAEPYNALVANHLKTVSGPDGSFRFDGVVPGVAVLHYPWSAPSDRDLAKAVKNRSWIRAIPIREAEHIDGIRIELAKSTAAVEVRVIDREGKPIAGSAVHASVIYETPTEHRKLYSRESLCGANTIGKTNEEGRCRLIGLPPGTLLISAFKNGKASERVAELREGETTAVALTHPGSHFTPTTGAVVVRAENTQKIKPQSELAAQRARPKQPQHLARISVLNQQGIVWGEAEDGLVVGIGELRTSLKSPLRPIIAAYLENRGENSVRGVTLSRAHFVLELDGKSYAEENFGGPVGLIEPGKRYGPINVTTDYFNEVERLKPESVVAPIALVPRLSEGQHTLRLYYMLWDEDKGRQLIPSRLVRFNVRPEPYPVDQAVAMLVKALKDANPNVRGEAALAAGNLRLSGCRDALIETLKDKDKTIRRYAAESLGKIGDAEAVAALREMLKDGEMEVRLAAVESLVELGVPLETIWVEPIIKSKHSVFQNAIWLVRRHAGKQAVPTLIRCLDHNDASVNNYYNYTLVWQIRASGGPDLQYHHDSDGAGTPNQDKHNRNVLTGLKTMLGKHEEHDSACQAVAGIVGGRRSRRENKQICMERAGAVSTWQQSVIAEAAQQANGRSCQIERGQQGIEFYCQHVHDNRREGLATDPVGHRPRLQRPRGTIQTHRRRSAQAGEDHSSLPQG